MASATSCSLSLGNPGIDVQHYTLLLDYDPAATTLSATEQLDMRDDRGPRAFSLDSDGPVVSAVSVDGVAADVRRRKTRSCSSRRPAKLDQRSACCASRSRTRCRRGRSPSAAGEPVGWFTTPGGSYVLNEPEGAHTWLPSNDHPSDKATFHFEHRRSPSGVTAVANGALIDHTSTAVDRHLDLAGRSPDGDVPHPAAHRRLRARRRRRSQRVCRCSSVVLRQDRATMQPFLDAIDDQIDFFDDFFGPYPFDRYGIAITDSVPGLAMETMERSHVQPRRLRVRAARLRQELFLSHELAHQWFGDAVSPGTLERHLAQRELRHVRGVDVARPRSVCEPIADSAPARRWQLASPARRRPARSGEMFGYNSYDGGAVILHALRQTIGDDLFFTLLRRWVTDNIGTSRTTEDFVALASRGCRPGPHRLLRHMAVRRRAAGHVAAASGR